MNQNNKKAQLVASEIKLAVSLSTLDDQSKVWEVLFREVVRYIPDIFQETQDGKIKINWVKVILSIGRIVGVLLAIKKEAGEIPTD